MWSIREVKGRSGKRWDKYLNNPLHTHTNLRQYPLDILAALLRFIRDAAFNQRASIVGGDLARDVDLWARDDGLGLWWASVQHNIGSSQRLTCVLRVRAAVRGYAQLRRMKVVG
jgi:hypothetical protein